MPEFEEISEKKRMQEKKYHHGDLRNALIEAGIELINEYGESGMSLRKVAAKCGVSAAAPYAHFQNKEEMLGAIQDHITEQMMEELPKVLSDEKSALDNMLALGEAYIQFFMNHPTYFKFFCFSSHMSINLTKEADADAYPPYLEFRKYALACLREMGCDEKKDLYCMVNMWATVQGIALLATQPNVTYAGNWKDDLMLILTNGRSDETDNNTR